MAARRLLALMALISLGCTNTLTTPDGGAAPYSSSSALEEGLPSYSSVEDAKASLGGITDFTAAAQTPSWSSYDVSSAAHFRFKWANRASGMGRLTTFLGSTQTRTSGWLNATGVARLGGGWGDWEMFDKEGINIPLTNSCGLSAQSEAHGEAKYVALINSAITEIFRVPDDDQMWSDQGACAPPPCEGSDSGAVTSAQQPSYLVRSNPDGPKFDCGAEAGSPGGGGAPTEDPVYGCYWARDYVIYTDGSWDWLSDWYQVCGWAELQADASSRDADQSSPAQTSAFRVRLVGTGPHKDGRVATIARLNGETVSAEVAIDTTRASASDVENALASAQLLIDGPTGPSRSHRFAVIGDAPAVQRNALGPQNPARGYLRTLLSAPERVNNRAGKGRTVEVSVARRRVRITRRAP